MVAIYFHHIGSLNTSRRGGRSSRGIITLFGKFRPGSGLRTVQLAFLHRSACSAETLELALSNNYAVDSSATDLKHWSGIASHSPKTKIHTETYKSCINCIKTLGTRHSDENKQRAGFLFDLETLIRSSSVLLRGNTMDTEESLVSWQRRAHKNKFLIKEKLVDASPSRLYTPLRRCLRTVGARSGSSFLAPAIQNETSLSLISIPPPKISSFDR